MNADKNQPCTPRLSLKMSAWTWWLLLILATAIAVVGYMRFLYGSPSYREALEQAADMALPGSRTFLTSVEVQQFVVNVSDAGRAAYAHFLKLDYVLAALVALLFLTIAVGTWSLGLKKRSAALAAGAMLAAICDFFENSLLRDALAHPNEATRLAS